MNTQFVSGLLNPEAPTPEGLSAPGNACLDTRYAVYRNNVTSSLIDALEEGFPATQEILGPRYFRALAAEFVRKYPPESPLLSLYGTFFPAFLRLFPPLACMPWLADVAQLELALRESNDAPDYPVDASVQLAATQDDTIAQLVPHRHPSARWIDSRWPVYSLWQLRTTPTTDGAEQVLIVRPGMQVTACLLPACGIDFLETIDGDRSLGELAANLLELCPDIDIPALMHLLIKQGALAHFTRTQGMNTA